MGERKEKEKKEKEEKDALAKKEKEEKEAIARKEKEEKEAAAKKEKEEKEAQAKKERDERRRKEREEREEKQKQSVKKEIPSDDVKDNDKPKKKLVPIKSKPKDASLPKVRKAEAKGESNDGSAVKARKVMPSKPLVHKSSTPPPSKLKKDESNKKGMETRKAAAARTATRKQPDNEDKNRLSKASRPSTRKPKEKVASGEERKVDEATVVEKVSKAIASGEIDDSRVVKEDEELQRIKDEEEEEDNQERVPDIGPSEDKKEADEAPPRELDLEKAAAPKVAYSHVKTPDEVDDLPEHEVVNPDESMLEEIKSEMSYDLEEKIAKDESEKEVDVAKKDKSEGSIEALKENEEVEVHIEQMLVQKADMEPADDDENKLEAAEDDKDICDNKEA